MYQRILLTDDGSEVARAAVPHAATLARGSAASVLALRVSDAAGESPRDVTSESWSTYVDRARGALEPVEAEPHLSDVVAALREAGVQDVGALVVKGDAGSAIVEVARRVGCDLIVMSTTGRSGLRRAVLGSVADHVVHHSPGIPVLLCRGAGDASD